MTTAFVSRISGEITMETALRIQSEFKEHIKNGANSITLILDSPGGSVAAGLMIHELVANLGIPVTGVALGECGSIAFTILQACTSRGAQPETRFMVHFLNFATSAMIYYDSEVAARIRDVNVSTQEDIIRLHVKRSSLTREQLIDLMKENRPITTRQAMKYGMIDVVTIRGTEGWLTA